MFLFNIKNAQHLLKISLNHIELAPISTASSSFKERQSKGRRIHFKRCIVDGSDVFHQFPEGKNNVRLSCENMISTTIKQSTKSTCTHILHIKNTLYCFTYHSSFFLLSLLNYFGISKIFTLMSEKMCICDNYYKRKNHI